MNLAFQQKFPWEEETLFKEKILACEERINGVSITPDTYPIDLATLVRSRQDDIIPKLHTFREDPKDRWKPGYDIHHLYNSRKKNRDNFLINRCHSIQNVSIIHEVPLIGKNELDEDVKIGTHPVVLIDGRWMSPEMIETIAKNDGFKDTEQFFRWFNKNFIGKIIHWTKLRY